LATDESSAFRALPGPELVFGLVGPAGVDFGKICLILSEALGEIGYQTEEI